MNRRQIRLAKHHFAQRWAVFHHNRKNTDKLLLLEDKFIINNLVPGQTLAVNCLGEIYKDIIQLDVTPAKAQYNNVLLINNLEFKYKTIDEIAGIILANNLLVTKGRMIVNLNLMFIKYDRINITINLLIDQLVQQLLPLKLLKQYVNIKKWTQGFGQIFLVLENA